MLGHRRGSSKLLTSLVLTALALGCAPTSEAPEGPASSPPPPTITLETRPVPAPSGPGAMAPGFTRLGDGLGLAWLEPVPRAADRETRWRLRFARLEVDPASDDLGGASGPSPWSEPVTITRGGDPREDDPGEERRLFANWADTPRLAEAADGSLWAAWLEKLGAGTYAYGIALARSGDRGDTWEPRGWLHRDLSETEHGFVSLVADAPTEGDVGLQAIWLDGRGMAEGPPVEGTPAAEMDHASGEDGAPGGHGGHGGHGGGTMALYTARVGVPGSEILLDPAVCDCCATGAARTPRGLVVAYRDRSPEEIRDIWTVRQTSSGQWSSPAAVHSDGWHILACPVNGPEMATGGADEGSLWVAWFTAANGRPRVLAARSDDHGMSFRDPLTLDTEGPLGRVGMARLGDGDVVVSWLGTRPREGDPTDRVAIVRLQRLSGTAGSPESRGPIVDLAETAGSRASGVPRLLAHGDHLWVTWVEPEGDAEQEGTPSTPVRLVRLEQGSIPGG